MVGNFKAGQWDIQSSLYCQKTVLLVDEFSYWISWFVNATDDLDPNDFNSVATAAGYTVLSSPYYFNGASYFLASPSFQLTEALARADAWVAINAMVSGFTALGY